MSIFILFFCFYVVIIVFLCVLFLWIGCVSQKVDVLVVQVESNVEIMNNQEVGVDEGGIVKNIGDYFVVLCQGRFFVVNVVSEGLVK